MQNARGGRCGYPGGLVEGRLRDAATCGERRNWFHVRSLNPAQQASEGRTPIQHIATEEYKREYRRIAGERRGDCDPKAEAAIPAADFARLVLASRGAHCRPLHPGLASLCSAPEAAFVGPVSGETTESKGFTATASQDNPDLTTFSYRRTFRDGIAVI
jgi:hypothetical protein